MSMCEILLICVIACCIDYRKIILKIADGCFEGLRYFKPRARRGRFVRLLALQPDKRLPQQANSNNTQFAIAKEHRVIKQMDSNPDNDKKHVKMETVSQGNCIDGTYTYMYIVK